MANNLNKDASIGNGSVVLTAGTVAGAIGGIATLLNEARKAKTKPSTPSGVVEVTRDEVARSVAQLRDSLDKITQATRDQAPELVAKARAQATDLASQLGERSADARSGLSREANRGGDVLNSRVNDVKSRGKSVAKNARHGIQNLDPAKASAAVGAGAAATASAAVTQAIDAGRARGPELVEAIQDRVVPGLKDLGRQASDAARHLAESGRDQAPELVGHVTDYLAPKLQESRDRIANQTSGALAGAERARASIVPEVKDTAEDLGKRFVDSLAQAEKSFESLRGGASGAVDTVGNQAKVVGTQAVSGGKNGIATLFWLGTAGVVIYKGLLNPEQRAQVASVSSRAAKEAIDLFKDVRGRDGTFSNSGSTERL